LKNLNANTLVKLFASIAVLLMGFSFFYYLVIFKPSVERYKLSEIKKSHEVNNISQGRASMLKLLSVYDKNFSKLLQEDVTYGELQEIARILKMETLSLRKEVYAIQSSEKIILNYVSDFNNILDLIDDIADTQLKIFSSFTQLETAKGSVKNSLWWAEFYKTGNLADPKQVKESLNNSQEQSKEVENKKRLLDGLLIKFNLKRASISNEIEKLAAQYAPYFNVNVENSFKLLATGK